MHGDWYYLNRGAAVFPLIADADGDIGGITLRNIDILDNVTKVISISAEEDVQPEGKIVDVTFDRVRHFGVTRLMKADGSYREGNNLVDVENNMTVYLRFNIDCILENKPFSSPKDIANGDFTVRGKPIKNINDLPANVHFIFDKYDDYNELPAAPGNLTAETKTATHIDLAWSDSSNNEWGFKIERSGNGSICWSEIVENYINIVKYSDLDLLAATTYNYRVRAYNNVGFSDYSNVVEAATIELGVPDTVAIYRLYGDVADSYGGFNGMLYGNPNFETGLDGQALVLDGVDDYAEIPSTIQDDFTIAYWIKTRDSGNNGSQWYSGKGIVDGEVSGFKDDFGTSLTGGKIAFGIGQQGGGDVTIKSTSDINDGAWHHVAVTRNAASGEMKIYIDGLPKSIGTGSTGSKSTPAFLHIGNLQTNIKFLKAAIDHIFLFENVISESYIKELADKNLAAVDESKSQSPLSFQLFQNYLNPFNQETTIKYQLPEYCHVTLKVFNAMGQEVATLINKQPKAGYYSVNWNVRQLASGLYFYWIKANEFSKVCKMLVLK